MEEILKMIESVSIDDDAKLEEIDILVGTYLGYDVRPAGDGFGPLIKQNYYFVSLPSYTRSRDALKAIRPKGYWFGVDENGTKGWQASMNDPDRSGRNFIITRMPTEELAELHVIIQAITYERAQQPTTQSEG